MKFIIKFITIISLTLSSSALAEGKLTPLPSVFANISVIGPDNVKEIITGELAKKDITGNIKVKLKGFTKGIQLKTKKDSFDYTIPSFSVNKRSRRFKSVITFRSGSYIEAVEVNGRYNEVVNIPALSYKVPHHTVISDSDIVMIEIEKNKLNHDTITDANDLVGKVLKRSMRDRKPIRKRDLDKEDLISRNNVINMVYKTPFIQLQTTGIALEGGAKGDLITVRNTTSKKTVLAKVEDSGKVIINSAGIL